MQLVRRFRLPALFCALALLLCELISRPSAAMGICDDWSYIVTAHQLASTGHIVYNGWATAMLGWQLYLGAAFIKLFGFSFTTVRMSTLLLAMLTAFFLQRTLVRAGISERNAVLGTLTLVLSPLFMLLSVTYMTDIPGLFAVVLCLYSCLRALQSKTPRSTLAWLCFAIVSNVLCGTSRQIAWLGVLVMVPSTLYYLYTQRRLPRRHLVAASSATLVGWLTIFAILQWFKHQPYSIPEHLLPKSFSPSYVFSQFSHTFLDIPFLLLPIVLLFYPALRTSSRRTLTFLGGASIVYLLLVYHWRHFTPNPMLEPTHIDWVTIYGIYKFVDLQGLPPVFLSPSIQAVLTVLSIGGLFCLTASLAAPRKASTPPTSTREITWRQLRFLLGPFTLVYTLILLQRATEMLLDRYTLPLLVVALIYALRLYQDRIQPRVPSVAWLAVCLFAVYGIACTHNLFSLYRARVALAAELRSSGIPDTSVDNGWEYNGSVELQHSPFINLRLLVFPANAYTPMSARHTGPCALDENVPHIHPLYAISFDPNACQGPTKFAPLHYSRWLAAAPGTLYVVADPAPTPP